MTKFFILKKKPYFGVIFPKEVFLKTLAKYNYIGPHHLNVKDTE